MQANYVINHVNYFNQFSDVIILQGSVAMLLGYARIFSDHFIMHSSTDMCVAGTVLYFPADVSFFFFSSLKLGRPSADCHQAFPHVRKRVYFDKLGQKFGTSPLTIWGPKNENLGSDFEQLPDLTAKNFGVKRDINRKVHCKLQTLR